MKTKFHWMLCLALLLSLLFTPAPAAAEACDPAFVTQAGRRDHRESHFHRRYRQPAMRL